MDGNTLDAVTQMLGHKPSKASVATKAQERALGKVESVHDALQMVLRGAAKASIASGREVGVRVVMNPKGSRQVLEDPAASVADALKALAPTHASKAAAERSRARKAGPLGDGTPFAFKAETKDDEDGVIIGRVSVAGNFDREKERVLESALKAATWELAMNPSGAAVDINHEEEAIGCDIVGVYYDYSAKACTVHLRPHDRAIYEAAKSGEIVGFSWCGPYKLKPAA